jgi:hypothetical protein
LVLKDRGGRFREVDMLVCGLGLAVVNATAVFLLGALAAVLAWESSLIEILARVYIGYGPSFGGAFLGAFWGFVDGFALGVIGAWAYNRIVRKRG